MHAIKISDEVLAMVRRQRDRLHVFEHLNPRRTAHLVVDLQNGFVEAGAPVEVPTAREIVDNVNSVSAALRARGGHVIFLRMTVNRETQSSWSNWFMCMLSEDGRAATSSAFEQHSHHWALWPKLSVEEGDTFVNKTRFSAFIPGASGLHEILQHRGIDTLIITGTLSNCCCESTARDAMQMNYKIIFVADANAAMSDAAHNATLENMILIFADVMTTEEVVSAIGSSGG